MVSPKKPQLGLPSCSQRNVQSRSKLPATAREKAKKLSELQVEGLEEHFGCYNVGPKKETGVPPKKKSYKDTDFAHTSKNPYGTSNIESLVEMIFPFASGCFSQIPAVHFQGISFRESFHRLWKRKNDKVETRNTMLQNQSQPFLCVKRNMVHQKMEA